MNIEKLRQLNITVLFSEPINHSSLGMNELQGVFNSGDKALDEGSILQAPGLSVLGYPKRNLEIVFENSRVQINDGVGKEIEQSQIWDNFSKLLKQSVLDLTKVVAYGFNFDVLVNKNEDSDTSSFLSEATKSLIPGTIEKVAFNVGYKKDDVKHDLIVNPLGAPGRLLVHLNVNFSSTSIPQKTDLVTSMKEKYAELQGLIQQL